MGFIKQVLDFLRANGAVVLAVVLVTLVVRDIALPVIKFLGANLFKRAQKSLPAGAKSLRSKMKRALVRRGNFDGKLNVGELMEVYERVGVERLHPRYQEELAQMKKAFEVMPKLSLNLPGFAAFNRVHGPRFPGD